MVVKQFMVFNSINAAPRYFSVKDGKEARKAALLCAVLMLLGSVIWFLPPMTARILYPELVMAFDIGKPAEASYAVASMSLLPAGLIGLIVVAILAATMSSMDTGLNTNVAILVKDVYPKLARLMRFKPRNESELLGYGRLLTWVMGGLIIVLSLYFAQQDGKGIFELMIEVGTLLSTPITIPLMLGLFVRRTPWWAALSSIASALLISCIVFFDIPLTVFGFSQSFSDSVLWSFQQQFFCVLIFGTLGFLISIPFAPSKDSEHRKQVDDFFTVMKTPIDFAREVGEGNDLKQLVTIGWFGIAISIFITSLLLIPNPLGGRLAILALAIVIGVLSALMLKRGKAAALSKPYVDEPA
jgi:Na+/proline symporter